jgi:TolA-binding protein
MRQVVRDHQLTSTICDDAMYWIARSYEREGNPDQAANAWGEIMRDYSWSRYAIDNQHKYKPAGPMREHAGD